MMSSSPFSNPPPTINLPNMSVPPPVTPNLSAPPPTLTTINTSGGYQHNSRYSSHRESSRGFFKPFRPYHAPKIIPSGQDALQDEFDGKRLRKSVMRKTVDYNSAIIKSLENRIWQRDYRDRRALQPDVIYYPDLLPPPSYVDNPINAVTTRFVKTATNKMRCPIFCMAWTPEGRRLVTGASSGEFTLWNGLTFNFETILQAHDSPVRTMVWSHNESWMVTGDHAGYVKYWQSNMNNVKMFQAHKEAIRGLSFSSSDHKLATCSDDGTVRIWDFQRCHEERILRGHGADVKCVHWHPQKSLIISGSKDNQQPVKLWDPKTGQSLATLHAHKSTVMDVKWNENGNWLVTASRDHLLKLFDLRNLSQEVQTFRGHKKEASSVAWHPSHEGLFCSGGSDGAILFWHVGADKEVGAIEQAHDSIVWTLAWHPLGHILCSGSNDHTSKFWTRNRPGDLMRDKYNLNTLPAGAAGIDDHEVADDTSVIPGMGIEDQINIDGESEDKIAGIPGLDLDHAIDEGKKFPNKKVPYSKPIPRNFQAQWNEMEGEDLEQVEAINAIVNQLIETTPGAVPLNEVEPHAIILYGKMIPVEPGSKLAEAVTKGNDAINKLVLSGEIEELRNVMGPPEVPEEPEDYLKDDGEIDYSKVPDIDLPLPLPSSKFAQNPELLKALNRGGKRKFDQLIGWSDGASNDRLSKNHQPVFGGSSLSEDSASGDTDLRFSGIANSGSISVGNSIAFGSSGGTSTILGSSSSGIGGNGAGVARLLGDTDNFGNDLDEDFRRSSTGDSRTRGDKDFTFNFSGGPGRPNQLSNMGDKDLRQMGGLDSSFIDLDRFTSDRNQDGRQRWDDLNDTSRNDDHFDNRDSILSVSTGSNHHNMQNINPNVPPPSITGIGSPVNSSQNSNKLSSLPMRQGMDVSASQIMHHSIPPFGPNGPVPSLPSSFGPGNFRSSPNGNFPFRPNLGTPFTGTQCPPPFANNNFSGPPPNFRNMTPNFDRQNFNSNFRRQSPNDNFNSSFGNFGNQNGPNRGSSNHGSNDSNGRNNYNNRNRSRDNY